MRRRAFIAGIGAAAAWPLAARAQPSDRMKRVGVLMSTAEGDPLEISSINAFITGLAKLGWVQGKNLDVSVRWGATDIRRMTANAEELVSLGMDAILTKGAATPAAGQATKTIPIVFVSLPETVVQSLVGSVSRPVGNITGFTTFEYGLVGKRLGLLRDLSPRISRVLYIRLRESSVPSQPLLEQLKQDASAAGLSVTDAPSQNAAEIESAIRAFAASPDGALLPAFAAFTIIHRQLIVDMAALFRLPAVFPSRNFAGGDGLCSYGFDQNQQFREGASYVARLLAGAKPSDLPVQTPTKFQLFLNLKTAKALDLAISPSLLASADEVIE